MRKDILILCFLFLCKISFSQIDSSDYKDHSLYLYKTEDDFFNKNKTYRGQYIPSDDKKVIKYSTLTSKKKTLNLEDSCMHYFGYQIGDEIQIRPDKNPRNSTYYVFGGGTRDLYFVVYGHLPNYDKKGYLHGLSSPAGIIYAYIIDKYNQLNMVQLPEFLKSRPKLLEQYKAEKSRTGKIEWERNRLDVAVKYLKLVIAEQK